jgi:deazaflavin-dependent oxidoreductase (nitroreductase family)
MGDKVAEPGACERPTICADQDDRYTKAVDRANVARRPHRPRLVAASALLAAPGLFPWALRAHRGSIATVLRAPALMLLANVVLTRLSPSLKLRFVRAMQRYLINPPVRLLVTLGVLPLGYALLETIGRNSGTPRRVPVGNGLIGDTFWIVAEHGHDANYVRNLKRDPRVRVKVRKGLRPVWRQGHARVLEDDDPHDRQRALSRGHPLRALNAAVVRVMGTDLLTIRIELES